MPESDPQTKFRTLSLSGDRQKHPRRGYIRSDANHRQCEWSFEVLSEQPKVGLVTIMTADGPLRVAINRVDATSLLQKLQLFLADWPEDQQQS
jgi:hypothetical protein